MEVFELSKDHWIRVNRGVEVAETGWMGSGMCECKNGDLSKVDWITPFTLHQSQGRGII